MRPLSALLALSVCAAAASISPSLYGSLQWRLIGPFRGGRVAAVAGVAGNATTFYTSSVGGGVWKTTNAGVTWTPIFDSQTIASIGALAVAPSDSNILYAGTGEADIRSQIGFGDGVYKSTDAGLTWQNVGLKDTRQIACIRVDPHDPNLVYVAALGHVYGSHPDRGVYRSRDGGRTWQKVLDKGPEIGAVDLALDPTDPRTIYATMWNARRTVWSQYAPIEGPGSGLYKSTDSGATWTQLTGHGLPEAQWGRAGIAVAAGGKRVFALIDAAQAQGGLYRSEDAGANWSRVSSDARTFSRNWYFAGITADPKNPDLVYVPNVALYRSTDGGRTFTVLKGAPGGDDYRILWIDPTDTSRMLLGSDQGTNVSVDAGATWSSWYNQPTAQMYHVITDNQWPYHVYGSQQDSGTAAIPSRTNHGMIDARDWYSVGGAESGYIAVDSKDPNILYVNNTGGQLARFDKRTGQSQNITPNPLRNGRNESISAARYRFPWTAPVIVSPTEPGTVYYGTQVLLKTTDGGLTWKEISGDLTGDTRPDKSVVTAATTENARELGYGVIYSIAPSPLRAGMIWAGSDTGLVHLTRDGGKTWQNVTPPGLSAWSKITQIEASHFDPAEAWAAVDRHRLEDYRPYIYRTRDYGKTWTLITDGLAEPRYLNSIREDPRRRGLLFACTEISVAVSFDDGDHWQTLRQNLPAVSVRDLVVHGDDLVIATFGRGFWIMDDITPLRQVTAQTEASEAMLFKPADAVRVNPDSFFGTPFPPEEPQAKNPPDGAIFDYYLKAPGEVTIEILDAKGASVAKLSTSDRPAAAMRAPVIADYWIASPERVSGTAGHNRVTWDLRYALPPQEASPFGRGVLGPLAAPGSYQVKLTAAGKSYTQGLKVALDPRSTATAAEMQKLNELNMSILRDLRRVADAMKANPSARGRLMQVNAMLTTALGVAGSADRTPPASAYELADKARAELDKLN